MGCDVKTHISVVFTPGFTMASSDCESCSSHSSSGYCLLADERSDNESQQVARQPIGSCAYIFEPYAAEKPAPGSEIPIVNEDIDRFQHHE